MYLKKKGGMNITNLLNIKHFLNTSSYFTNHLSKSLRVIVNISVITSLVLAQSLTASNYLAEVSLSMELEVLLQMAI